MTDHKTLTAALVAFQAELPDVSKGGNNPAFKSKYATLPDVTKAVFPVLARHGLAWVTMPDETETGHVLRWELRHVSGESLTGVWPLPDGVKAQELGSWITYGRRYTLSAVTGITPDEDDDGNGATSPARRREPAQRTPSQPVDVTAHIAALKAATNVDDLRSVFEGLPANVRSFPQIVAAKDAAKEALTVSVDASWAVAEVPS
jgi:hypothetical protein